MTPAEFLIFRRAVVGELRASNLPNDTRDYLILLVEMRGMLVKERVVTNGAEPVKADPAAPLPSVGSVSKARVYVMAQLTKQEGIDTAQVATLTGWGEPTIRKFIQDIQSEFTSTPKAERVKTAKQLDAGEKIRAAHARRRERLAAEKAAQELADLEAKSGLGEVP